MMRKRRYNFTESKGKGVRKFDNFRAYRIADARTQADAQRLAKFIRQYGTHPKGSGIKVRVVPYQAGKKTHYSVYADREVTVAHKGYVDALKKQRKDPTISRMLSRVIEPGYYNTRNTLSRKQLRGTPILLTKKRLPELGLRMRWY